MERVAVELEFAGRGTEAGASRTFDLDAAGLQAKLDHPDVYGSGILVEELRTASDVTYTVTFVAPVSGALTNVAAATSVTAGDGPIDVTVGDFNEDGTLDLAVVNELSNDLLMLLGDGNGGFTQGPSAGLGRRPRAVVADDFDLDGHLDTSVVHYETRNAYLMLGLGNGKFRTVFDLDEEPGGLRTRYGGDPV